MQLWAMINSAVLQWGTSCGSQGKSYVQWHGEDGYGLRGNDAHAELIGRVSRALKLKTKTVARGFVTPKNETLEKKVACKRDKHGHFEGYGKWKCGEMELNFLGRCASEGNESAMSELGYGYVLK